MNTTISPEHQKEILDSVQKLASSKKDPDYAYNRHLILMGVWLALGDTCPPHWVMNIQCGRTDRLFEEETPRKNYDVLGLKGKEGR